MSNQSIESDRKAILISFLTNKAKFISLPRSTVQEFRPNSNLQFVSKLTELVVASQIQCQMTKIISSLNCNLSIAPIRVLKVTNDLLMNMDKGHLSLLLLLDLSATFDTADFTTIASNKTRCLWYRSFLVQIELGREISN